MRRIPEVLVNPQELRGAIEWRVKSLQNETGRAYRRLYDAFWHFSIAPYRYLYDLPSVDIDALAPPLEQSLELILEHICLPPYLGSSFHDDVTPLMRIVKHVNPRILLGFGTAHGNTIANICRMCDAQAYTINALPEKLTGNLTTYSLSKEDIGCVYRQYGLEKRVVQIYANTLHFSARDYFTEPCVDLVIIDACHDTKYVINDFRKALDVVRKGGTVLFHDTHPSMDAHLGGAIWRASGCGGRDLTSSIFVIRGGPFGRDPNRGLPDVGYRDLCERTAE